MVLFVCYIILVVLHTSGPVLMLYLSSGPLVMSWYLTNVVLFLCTYFTSGRALTRMYLTSGLILMLYLTSSPVLML